MVDHQSSPWVIHTNSAIRTAFSGYLGHGHWTSSLRFKIVGDPKTTILMRKYDGTIVIKPKKICNPRLSAWLSVFKPSTWFSASQFGRPWNCYEALSLDGPQIDPMQLYPLAPQGAMRLGQLGQLMSRHPPRCKTMIRSFCDRIIPEVCGYIGAPNKWSLG